MPNKLEWIKKITLCKVLGHDNSYRYTIVDMRDNKKYSIGVCKRCWTETKKEVE
jgi:hypothetical protein